MPFTEPCAADDATADAEGVPMELATPDGDREPLADAATEGVAVEAVVEVADPAPLALDELWCEDEAPLLGVALDTTDEVGDAAAEADRSGLLLSDGAPVTVAPALPLSDAAPLMLMPLEADDDASALAL